MTTPAGSAWFDAVRADPGGALMAFDFDGTLSPIVDDPDRAAAHPEARDRLTALAQRIGHLAVVTGRPADVAVERLGLRSVVGLGDVVVLGHYGLQRWDSASGEISVPDPDPGLERVRRELPRILADTGMDGAYVEDKGAAVAVHTRRLPDPAGALERLRTPLADLASDAGLALEPGRLVLELRPPGVDKGGALRSLVAEVRVTSVAFAGDDLGDLAAFDAVDELRAEGVRGLLVCSGSAEVQALAARADLVVEGPDGLMHWLASLVELLGGED
jgi:trehalose 6-phosphate phosphatase